MPDVLHNGLRPDDDVVLVGEHPDVWTDGSLVLDDVSGASSSGSGFYAHFPGQDWKSRRWGHLDDIGPVGGVLES